MDIYDLYVTNIQRKEQQDPYSIGLDLKYSIDKLFDELELVNELGTVDEIKIPDFSFEISNKAKSCYGFVRMTRSEQHERTASILNGQWFHDLQACQSEQYTKSFRTTQISTERIC